MTLTSKRKSGLDLINGFSKNSITPTQAIIYMDTKNAVFTASTLRILMVDFPFGKYKQARVQWRYYEAKAEEGSLPTCDLR